MPYWRKEWIVTEICDHKNVANDTIILYLPTAFHGPQVGAGDMRLKYASVGRATSAGTVLTMREEY
jgi:hypothetical protein